MRRQHDQGKWFSHFNHGATAQGWREGGIATEQSERKSCIFCLFGRLCIFIPPCSNVPPPVSTSIYGVFLPCFYLVSKDGVVTLQKVLRDLGGGMRARESGNGRRRGTPAPCFDLFDIFLLFTAHDLFVAASFHFYTLVVILYSSTRRSGRAQPSWVVWDKTCVFSSSDLVSSLHVGGGVCLLSSVRLAFWSMFASSLLLTGCLLTCEFQD